MNLQHLPTSVNSHQDITLHILMAHRLQAMSKHNQIQVWFLNFSASQQSIRSIARISIHQCCCTVDCILQILFSSYPISLSFNQSVVAKLRSISISSPCHFYFVLYCLIDFLALVFALIRVHKHWWDDITREIIRESSPATNPVFQGVAKNLIINITVIKFLKQVKSQSEFVWEDVMENLILEGQQMKKCHAL